MRGPDRADLVHAGAESFGHLGDFGNTSARFLIDNLDRVLVANDVPTDLLHLAPDRIDRIAQLMGHYRIAVTQRLQVIDQRFQLLDPALVLAGVVGLLAG